MAGNWELWTEVIGRLCSVQRKPPDCYTPASRLSTNTPHSVAMLILTSQRLNLSWSWKATVANVKLLVSETSPKHVKRPSPTETITTEIDLTLLKPTLLRNVNGPSVAMAGAHHSSLITHNRKDHIRILI